MSHPSEPSADHRTTSFGYLFEPGHQAIGGLAPIYLRSTDPEDPRDPAKAETTGASGDTTDQPPIGVAISNAPDQSR